MVRARLLSLALIALAQTSGLALAQTTVAATAEDARRHGPEIVAFTGVKPGDTVIDLIPGSGYWTRLFARAVGSSGHICGI